MFAAKGCVVKLATIKALYGNIKGVYLTIYNMFGGGNVVENVDNLTPYGQASIPPNGFSVLALPIEGSAKKLFVIGGVSSVPTIKHEFTHGESWSYSQFYTLAYQNDGIRAYRIGEGSTLDATMPNGEAFVQMMIDRITELENMIAGINNNYTALKNEYNTHKHSGITSGGGVSGAPSSTLTQTNIPSYSTLAKDKDYLTNGKALINNTGENYL